ncbi:TolC family protein [Edaphobacter aggregans]|uniref:TolC family protein n=1 Tax=Edaphobacter aggregans TaxID=570835 RepID=UPI00068AC88B|nr:TolC family protein [Edaphobacter aggregans]
MIWEGVSASLPIVLFARATRVVSWDPDLWGRIRRNIESAATAAQASSADLADVRMSLQGQLAAIFFQLRGVDLQTQLLDDTLNAYQDSLNLTLDLGRRGLASDTDVEEAKAQLETARAEKTALRVQRAQYEHAIAVFVGQPASTFHIAFRPLNALPPRIPGRRAFALARTQYPILPRPNGGLPLPTLGSV